MITICKTNGYRNKIFVLIAFLSLVFILSCVSWLPVSGLSERWRFSKIQQGRALTLVEATEIPAQERSE